VRGRKPATQLLLLNFPSMLGSEDEADSAASGSEALQTLLNHVVFCEYYLFRSDARIVNGDEAEPATNPPASTLAPPPATAPDH
jgi:hypothetical protein